MRSILLLSFIPYVSAAPLGNAYNAIFQPPNDDSKGGSACMDLACSAISTGLDRKIPIPISTATSAPTVTGVISASPTLPPRMTMPCILRIDYGLAPKSAALAPTGSPRGLSHHAARQFPGFPSFPFFGPGGTPRPSGTQVSAFPIPTDRPFPFDPAFPCLPLGNTRFPFPSGTPSFSVPSGWPFFPIPSSAPSFPIPSDSPSFPIPSDTLSLTPTSPLFTPVPTNLPLTPSDAPTFSLSTREPSFPFPTELFPSDVKN